MVHHLRNCLIVRFGLEAATLKFNSYTKQPKGFAFVQMEKESAAEEAIEALNCSSIDGRPIKVNLARLNNGS